MTPTPEMQRILFVLVYLMNEEIKALRSVLSEFEGDKSEYVQMIRAEDLRRVIEGLEYKI